MNKVLAIIPARSGSKGILNKNIKLLNDKPLISWTIEQALKAKLIDKIVISSDCDQVLKIASRYGFKDLTKRPAILSEDNSHTDDVIIYEMNRFPEFNTIIMLQPTSPLRSSLQIDQAIQSFFKKKAKAMVSVFKLKKSPFWVFKIRGNYLESLYDFKLVPKRRQDFKETYMLNGAIYITQKFFFVKQRSFLSNQTMYYEMSEEDSVDIDDIEDFKIAESLIKKKLSLNRTK